MAKYVLVILLFIYTGCSLKNNFYTIVKYQQKKTLDTTKLILKSYDYFITRQKEKEILICPLPFTIDLNKPYFSQAEVYNYLKKNNRNADIEVFNQWLKKVNENKKRSIDEYNRARWSAFFKVAKRQSYKGYTIYFRNQNTCKSESESSCIESIRRQVRQKLYGANDSIVNLVFSTNYVKNNNTAGIIPPFLMSLLRQALKETKGKLPDSLYQKVKQVNISLEPRETSLWVRSDDLKMNIYISPYLIRAAYIMVINKHSVIFDRYREYEKNLYSLFPQYTLEYINVTNHYIIDEFKKSFYFVFGHELAHIYLGLRTNGDANIEAICDCWALNNFPPTRFNTNLLGLYTNILEQSLISNNDSLWGVKNKAELLSRIEQVKQVEKNKGAGPCLTKPN